MRWFQYYRTQQLTAAPVKRTFKPILGTGVTNCKSLTQGAQKSCNTLPNIL